MLNQTEYLDVIIRHLNNPQDEKLRAEVFSIRSKSTDHENYFLEMEKVWSLSAKSVTLENIDIKKSVKNFKNILTDSTEKTKSNWYWITRIAAVLLITLTGLWIYRSNSAEIFIERTTHLHQIDTVALPDGSTIILDENSGLKYSNKFNSNDRNVYLTKGNAFFSIKKDAKSTFRVKIGESEVAVIGTSFNINLTTQKIDLDVKTGKVIFSPYKEGVSSILTKGQGLSYHIIEKQITARQSQNADSWVTKELVFVDTPLEEVCKQLSTYYHTTIKLKDNARTTKKLNATFTDQKLDDVLLLLNETYNIKIKKENNQILLITP